MSQHEMVIAKTNSLQPQQEDKLGRSNICCSFGVRAGVKKGKQIVCNSRNSVKTQRKYSLKKAKI